MTTASKLPGLLGHPVALDPATVKARREQLAGLPITKDEAAGYGSVASVIGDEFTLNVSDLIVQGTVSDLTVTGLHCPAQGEGGADPSASEEAAAREAATWLWDRWQASELASGTEGLFYAACGEGQAFLVLDFGADGQPAAYVNGAYDGESGIELSAVAADGTILAATKHETEKLRRDRTTGLLLQAWEAVRRMFGAASSRPAYEFVDRHIRTLYEYDRAADETWITHWVTDPGAPERQMRPTADGGWEPTDEPTRWPWGCPIVAFVSPRGGDLSEMESPQRIVNVAALTLEAAALVDGLRIGYILNCKPLRGDDGTAGGKITFRPGSFLQAQSLDGDPPPDSQIGAIPASDLTPQIEKFRLALDTALLFGRANVYNLPWYANAAPASGAAIYLGSAPYRAKIAGYQERFGASLARLCGLWLRMAGRPAREVEVMWAPDGFTSREEQLANAQAAYNLSLPVAHIAARDLDMTPDQAAEWQASLDGETQRRSDLAAQLAAAQGLSAAAGPPEESPDGSPEEEAPDA